MYIARRTGGGRGVYEIAGTTASGLTSGDLLSREVVLELSADLLIPSNVVLHVQGGKHRLVLANSGIQIQRQIAAALLLPSPRRADEGLGTSQEVVRPKAYAVERIQLEFVNAVDPQRAYVVPDAIEVKNLAGSTSISISERLELLHTVWNNAARFPGSLPNLIERHHQLVTAGEPITAECEQVVTRIGQAVPAFSPLGTATSGDTLIALAALLGLNVPTIEPVEEQPMTTPAFAFEGGFDPAAVAGVPERVRRAIIQRRGQRVFRQALVAAYGARCQVTEYTGEPALEAAHIYPYSEGGEYTNDPRNGLLLRADIHVLFDLGLVKITPGSLTVRIMPPLSGSSYAQLEGRTLLTTATLRPSDEALSKKWSL